MIDSTEVPSVEEAERQLEIARQESERIKKEQEEEQRREEEGEESQDGAGCEYYIVITSSIDNGVVQICVKQSILNSFRVRACNNAFVTCVTVIMFSFCL